MRVRWLVGAVLSFGCVAALDTQTLAQNYPARPIRLIVPFGAGGGTDNLARIVEPHVSRALGQSIIIDNRPGGGSVIGLDAVVNSPPDGYTLVMTDSSIAVNPSLLKGIQYNALKDLEPVSLLATAPVILVAHPRVPARTLKDFVALAKAQPGELNYASGGNGSSTHLGRDLANHHLPMPSLTTTLVAQPVHGEFVITLRLASGTDRGNGPAKRVPSSWRIASIVPDDALILPLRANPPDGIFGNDTPSRRGPMQ